MLIYGFLTLKQVELGRLGLNDQKTEWATPFHPRPDTISQKIGVFGGGQFRLLSPRPLQIPAADDFAPSGVRYLVLRLACWRVGWAASGSFGSLTARARSFCLGCIRLTWLAMDGRVRAHSTDMMMKSRPNGRWLGLQMLEQQDMVCWSL